MFSMYIIEVFINIQVMKHICISTTCACVTAMSYFVYCSIFWIRILNTQEFFFIAAFTKAPSSCVDVSWLYYEIETTKEPSRSLLLLRPNFSPSNSSHVPFCVLSVAYAAGIIAFVRDGGGKFSDDGSLRVNHK